MKNSLAARTSSDPSTSILAPVFEISSKTQLRRQVPSEPIRFTGCLLSMRTRDALRPSNFIGFLPILRCDPRRPQRFHPNGRTIGWSRDEAFQTAPELVRV